MLSQCLSETYCLETHSLAQGAFCRDGIVGCNLLLNYFFGDSIQSPKKEENEAEKDNYEKSEERNDGHDAEVKDEEGKDDEERDDDGNLDVVKNV